MSNDNFPAVPIPALYRRYPFEPQPLPPGALPQWPATPMHDLLTFGFNQTCHIWRHNLVRYLSPEPGEVCIPGQPLHEATDYVISIFEHSLSPEAYLKIADGIALAGFYEILREKTAGRLQSFPVASQPHTSPPDDAHAGLPSPPGPAHVRAWSTAHKVARRRWYELLPRGLPDAEYEVYRFRQQRDHVFREITAALICRLPALEAAEIAWAATSAGFYSAVAAIEFDDCY